MSGRRRCAALLALLVLLSGCATIPAPESRNSVAYTVRDDGTLITRHAPLIVPEYPAASYNRVGKPYATLTAGGRERIRVDPDEAAIYFQQRDFATPRGAYTNLIYRIHFEKVPFSLAPFHITTGRNSGLFVIVTVDSEERPLLLTTVHTCGCYLAFVPTSHLPRAAWPDDWPADGQRVYGMRLPGLLHYPAPTAEGLRPVIFLRHGNHRVRDIGLARTGQAAVDFEIVEAELLPIEALERLALADGGTTSFYHQRGLRRGYVKGASKPLELLLMSWRSLDPHVGVDKAYGERAHTGTVFYTSLKPWRRSASDMWRFTEFLDYWGWKL